MATATATKAQVTPALHQKYTGIFDVQQGFLAQYNVEREDVIEILGLSTIAGVDTLLLGEPGVGKTWAIELMLQCFGLGALDLFDILLTKEMGANEVLGPPDIMAMKRGETARVFTGMLPEAKYAYLDEIFKASPPLLNAFLDLMAKRQLKIGGKVFDCKQLVCMYFSSNELPDREDLMAMRDRIGCTLYVHPVRSPEGKRAVADIQLDYIAGTGAIDTSQVDKLDLAELDAIRTEVRGIHVPDATREAVTDAQDKWSGKGFTPSQRRMGQIWRMMMARAWVAGRDHVTNDDMIVAQHMAWNLPDHFDAAREVVLEYANVFARKAQRAREALEPVLAKLDEVKGLIDSQGDIPDEAMEKSWEIMRDLRRQRKEVRSQVQDGETQGHDVRDLKNVLGEIEKAHDYADKTFTGEDDD